MNLSEAFKQLDCLNEDVFEVSDKGIEELKDFRDSDDSDDTIEVIDPEAENKEEIKDSYVGKIICQCNVCKSLVYFDKDNIQIDEENGTVNADEECPFCFTNSGYSIVGEVAPYSDYQVEATDEDGNKVDVEVEVEVDGKKVSNESKSIKESIDLSVTDYEGILKFVTKGVQTDGKISRTIGTGDLEVNITPDDDSINKVISAAESIGFNEVDRFIDDSPTQGDSWVVLTKQSREGKCVLAIVFNAEHDYAFVNAGYDEDEDYEYFNESLENVKLDTGDQEIEITARDEKPTLGKDEMIAPLDDDTETEITSNDDEDSETEEKDEKLSLGKRKNESVRGNKMRKNCSESLDSIKLDDGNQKIEIKTKEKEDLPKDSMMVPPSDDTLEDILSDEEIDEEPMPEDGDIVDVDVDEVDDESFNRLGESFLKKVYENVKSFRTTSAATNGNTLVLEGLITFKSGKSKPTTFKFEANKINSKGKIRFLGENKDISSGRKSFALNCKVSKKAIIPESMTYNYVARGLNESQRVTGTVRLNESTRIRRR